MFEAWFYQVVSPFLGDDAVSGFIACGSWPAVCVWLALMAVGVVALVTLSVREISRRGVVGLTLSVLGFGGLMLVGSFSAWALLMVTQG